MRIKRNLKLISLVFLLFMIPFISADSCPPGLPPGNWVCGSNGVIINIDEGFFCQENNAWIDSTSGGVFSTIAVDDNLVYNCLDPYEGPSCCPSGSTCLATGADIIPLPNYPSSPYTCRASLNTFCSDFTDEGADECNGATSEIAIASIEPGKEEGYCGSITNIDIGTETCWDEVSCECYWDDEICTIKSNETRECVGGSSNSIETCEYDMVPTYNCDVDGWIYMDWVLVDLGGASDSDCEDIGQTKILCTDVTKLGFFNWINMIIAIMLIMGYYVYDFKKI